MTRRKRLASYQISYSFFLPGFEILQTMYQPFLTARSIASRTMRVLFDTPSYLERTVSSFAYTLYTLLSLLRLGRPRPFL